MSYDYANDPKFSVTPHGFVRNDVDQAPVDQQGAARFALRAAGLAVTGGLKLPTGSYGAIRRDADGALDVAEWGRRP